jgi:tripeptidyl-peptidase I
MYLFKPVVAALAVVAVRATTIPSSHVLHEKRTVSSSQWIESSDAPRDLTLPVRIGIKPKNAELGHDHLMDISNPASPNFGKHWTPSKIREFFSPPPETIESVQEWLLASEIASHRHQLASSRGSIQFNATVEELESLLKTKYKVWQNIDTGDLSLSCDEYYVPRDIGHHIDFITPTVGMGAPNSHNSKIQKRSRFSPISHPLPSIVQGDVDDLSTCNETITPACVRALYQIPLTNTSQAGNNLGIFELGDQYDQDDLNSFFTKYAPTIPNGTHPILNSIDGGVAPVPEDEGGGESILDFTIAYPLLYPQNITLFQVYDDTTADETYGLFNQFLDALDDSYCTYDGGDDPKIDPQFPDGYGWNQSAECGIYQPTNVISVSYAIAEAAYPATYAERQCHEYMKLGLQGVSVLFASGDNGTVARFGVDGCLPNDAQNPNFPASCPYGKIGMNLTRKIKTN